MRLIRTLWLVVLIFPAAGVVLGGNSTNSAATVPSLEAEAYLKVLAAQQATNRLPASTNAAAGPESTNASLITPDQLDNAHRLGVGDRVSYRVIEDKEDAKQLFVTDAGELEVPYIGRVAALGKTCLELAGQIKALLEKKYYYQATVIISLDLMNKTRGKIYLAGRVRVPGFQDIPTDEVFTVSKAILRAGGFGDFADQRHVKVTRNGNKAVIVVDVVQILEKGQAGKDMELRPDDRVFVPSRLVNF